jgi:hypothetical protein
VDLIGRQSYVRAPLGACRQHVVAALYHPLALAYNQKNLLDYVEACISELGRDFPAASIVVAYDLNQLMDQDLEKRTGLI